MPTVRTALRRPGALLASHEVRALVGFGLLGFVNVLLPAIIFSASYLIIPYSRQTVILIEGLSSLATKLILPHVLHYIPWWIRPCSLTICWIVAAAVTAITPPNVTSLFRILMTMLAAASAGAGDVSFLAQTRYYGRWGLAGWGAGTGVGGVVVAVMPHVLTSGMGLFLRSAVNFVYFLVAVMLAAYFSILPPAQLPRISTKMRQTSLNADGEDGILLTPEGHIPKATDFLRSKAKQSLSLAQPLLIKFIIPMFIAFTLQSFIYPASIRLQPMSMPPGTFTQFKAAFGAAFQMGSLVSRSSLLFFRWKQLHPLFLLLAVSSGFQLINLFYFIASSRFSVFLLASSVGVGGGAIYMTIYAAALDYTEAGASLAEGDLCVGLISSSESAGMMLGSLLGAFMEMGYCGSDVGSRGRWCMSTR